MSDFPSISQLTISVDAMGGDHGPEIVIPGIYMVHQEVPELHFIVFGDESRINPYLHKYPSLQAMARVVHTEKMVRNDEKPSAAVRASKGTSMRMAIEAVEKGQAQAIVSAGNTGALMALAKIVLRMLPGIHRPAIAGVFPTKSGSTVMLDLGANVLVDAENLVQFAVMGAVFAKAHKNIPAPTVGLLNVGSEEMKGPDHVRGAAEILADVQLPGRYYGFVEGDDIMKGTVDVIVCDGYVGNIALKTTEGVASFTGHVVKQAVTSNIFVMISGLFSWFALQKIKKKLDPRLYNGGVFLGLNGICVKSHGGTDAIGFASALRLAVKLAGQGYIKTAGDEITRLMSQDSFLAHGA